MHLNWFFIRSYGKWHHNFHLINWTEVNFNLYWIVIYWTMFYLEHTILKRILIFLMRICSVGKSIINVLFPMKIRLINITNGLTGTANQRKQTSTVFMRSTQAMISFRLYQLWLVWICIEVLCGRMQQFNMTFAQLYQVLQMYSIGFKWKLDDSITIFVWSPFVVVVVVVR